MAVAKDSAPAKKGRGLSLEEKRKRLSEYFLDKVRKQIHSCLKANSFSRKISFS